MPLCERREFWGLVKGVCLDSCWLRGLALWYMRLACLCVYDVIIIPRRKIKIQSVSIVFLKHNEENN